MLDSATIRRPGRNGGFDIGRLLDAMLYYDRVNVIVDPFSFFEIVRQLGFPDTQALLSHPTLVTSVVPELPVVQTENHNGVETHQPTYIQFAGRDGERPIKNNDVIGQFHHNLTNQPAFKDVKRGLVERTLRKSKKTSLRSLFGGEYSLDFFQSLVSDPTTLKLFIEGAARQRGWVLNREAFDGVRIEIIPMGHKTLASSDPTLEELFGGNKDVTWAHLLNQIHDYAIELYLGQALSSDFICSPAVAEVADARIDLSLQRASKSAEKIEAFEEAVFDEARLFGEAFNEGRLTIGGALNLIDRSRPMREWMKGLAPNADILREYQAELSKEPLLKSVPASIARFALFTGIGVLVHPLAGVGLSAFDSFVVDRISDGWRPSFFVENVREFIPKRDN